MRINFKSPSFRSTSGLYITPTESTSMQESQELVKQEQ